MATFSAGTLGSESIADNSITSAKILNNEIVDADLNASAAIAYSKLAALTSGNILVGSASNVATSVAMTGDATISATGVVTAAKLVHIATTTLSVAATTISFTGIATGFKSLIVMGVLRSDRAAQPTDSAKCELSTSASFDTTAANYDTESVNARSTTIDAVATDTNVMSANGAFLGADATAGNFASFWFQIGNTASAFAKTGQWTVGSITNSKQIEHGWFGWTNTAEIDGIRFAPVFGTNWIAGSQLTLLGVT